MHFFEAVKNGGVAMYAGIRAGDYLLRVNGHDVRTSSHKRVVKMISESKNSVTLDVRIIYNICQNRTLLMTIKYAAFSIFSFLTFRHLGHLPQYLLLQEKKCS